MENLILILKSAACLAILMAFYKLFLERLAIHKFKRFYLLGALLISIVIPFITFIKYVEPTIDFGTFDPNIGNTPTYIPAEILLEEPEPTNYFPTILWSIYSLGVLLFASKFCINLFGIVSKINKNEKQKHSNFISVLLHDLIVPHTFFSYIFLNKTKFETKSIPKEVLLHEQTHASQKHSLDILIIELLLIVFWFNPLLYFIKKDIKLNHEFLADDAVLKQGIDSSSYQNILLQFTSNANSIPLAHAINYSLIKKRFTIMKTQTSKRAIWLRSLLLLPLLGGLLFSFSSTKEVEKEIVPEMEIKSNYTARSIDIDVFKDGTYKIDGTKANKNTFVQIINQLHQDITPETRNNIINIHVNSPKNISDKEVWFIYNAVQNYGYHRIVAYNQEIIRSKGNTPFKIKSRKAGVTKLVVNGIVCDGCSLNLSKDGVANIILGTTSGDAILSYKIKFPGFPTETIKGDTLSSKATQHLNKSNLGGVVLIFDIKTVNKVKLSPIKITLVDKNDKKYSHSPKVVKGEKSTLPPPPPPPTKAPQYVKGKKITLNQIIKKTPKSIESGYEMLKNGESHYYTVYQGKKTYYNKDGYITNKDGKVLPPPPPPPAPPKVVKGERSNIPPPPPPPPAPQVKNIKERNTGYININGEAHYYATQNGETKYYNRFGNEVDKKGNKLSNTQTAGDKVVKGQKITKVYKDSKVVSEFKKTWDDDETRLPPPPPPMSTIDHVVFKAKKGASFFYNGKSISSDKAIAIVKNNPEINLSSKTNNGKSTVTLSNEPISISNERASVAERRKLLIEERKQATEERKVSKEEILIQRKEMAEELREIIEERKQATEERKAAKKEMLIQRKEDIENRKEIIEENRTGNSFPKPTAGNIVSHIKVMNRHDATFYLDGKKVEYSEALKAVRKNKNADVNSTFEPAIVKIKTI